MKNILKIFFVLILISAAAVAFKQVPRVEIHVGILSATGERSYGDSSFTYHLTDGYQVSNSADSSIIVSQLVYVNQVLNHGAPKDSIKFPYTFFFPVADSKRGNKISENLVSIKNLRDTTGVHNWLIRVCDQGYGKHTHVEMDKSHKLSLKIIYPNL